MESSRRLAPFIWNNVELYFKKLDINKGSIEPCFFLTIEWKYGKH